VVNNRKGTVNNNRKGTCSMTAWKLEVTAASETSAFFRTSLFCILVLANWHSGLKYRQCAACSPLQLQYEYVCNICMYVQYIIKYKRI